MSDSKKRNKTMHTITIHACAQAFDVPRGQVYLWIERGLLNSERSRLTGMTRIHVDRRYRRYKRLWTNPPQPGNAGGDGQALSLPEIDADAFSDTHFLVGEVAEMTGLSTNRIYQMTWEGKLTRERVSVDREVLDSKQEVERHPNRYAIIYDEKLHQLLQEHQ